MLQHNPKLYAEAHSLNGLHYSPFGAVVHLVQGADTYLARGASTYLARGASTYPVQGAGTYLVRGVGTATLHYQEQQ